MKEKSTYLSSFLSKWIANLGVVPLLLLRAFLLLPALTFFAFLLFLVTAVRETIFQLLKFSTSDQLKYKWNFKYLHGFKSPVKALLGAFSLFFSLQGQALEIPFLGQSLILGIGEIKNINASHITKFSLGNKEVIKAKLNKDQLLIRAVSQGSSDLLLWQKGRLGPEVTKVFVLSKKKRLEMVLLEKHLKEIELETGTFGEHLYAKGTIQNREQYEKLVALLPQPQLNLEQVQLERPLQKVLYGDFFQEVLDNHLDTFNCTFHGPKLVCRYNQNQSPDQARIKRWKKRFYLQLIPISADRFKQYQISLHILQTENSDGSDIHFGLEKIQSSWEYLFTSGLKGLINQNAILLKNEKVSIHSLAQPNLIIRPGHPVKIQVGSEMPFQQKDEKNLHTLWKFAGLELSLTLELHGDHLLIKYRSKLNRPSAEGSFSGNSQSSSLYVPLDQPIQLFQIGYQTFNEKEDQLPGIGSIPIIGRLFNGNSSFNQYKKISGILKIKEVYFD